MSNVAIEVLTEERPSGSREEFLALVAERPSAAFVEAPDANTFLPDVWEHLIDHYSIQSVLDIGAGAGWNAKWFVGKGIYTLGIESCKEALEHGRCRSNVVEHDYAQGSFVPACCFDLAWCAGFVQQIEEQFIPNFMASFQSCKYACLTFPEAGQPGYQHINCQSTEYWVKKMNDYGFDHDTTKPNGAGGR